MKVLEFRAYITPDNTLKIPPEVAAQIGREDNILVALLIPESADDQDWAHLTTEQFLKGYDEDDSIYDEI